MNLKGLLFAAAAGIGFNAAAAAQKKEAVQVPHAVSKLLPMLVRRPVWVVATAVSFLSWGLEVEALQRAPVALVVSFMSLGAGLLVVVGIAHIGERFRKLELIGIAIVLAGATVAAVSLSHVRPGTGTLSAIGLLVVAAICVIVAVSFAGPRTGVSFGLAGGALHAGTTIFSKQLADVLTARGFTLRTILVLLASPTPWLLVLLTVGALAMVQAGFQRANAASVTAAMTAVETSGPVVGGFLLYHERFPSGATGAALVFALLAVVGGSVLLTRTTTASGLMADL